MCGYKSDMTFCMNGGNTLYSIIRTVQICVFHTHFTLPIDSTLSLLCAEGISKKGYECK